MKILLLQPIIPIEVRWGKFKKGSGFVPPLGLVSIAGYLDSKKYNVTVCDAQLKEFTESDLIDYLSRGQYDLIGIPAFTNSIIYSFKTAEVCKKTLPNSMVVLGGVHSSAMPEQVLQDCPFVDAVIMGEGEYIMEDIAQNLQNGQLSFSEIKGVAYRRDDGQIIINQCRPPIDDINELPVPAYHLIDMSRYNPHVSQYKLLPNFPVVIQRGCPFDCAFCHARVVHGKKVRFRSVDKVIEELRLLINKYGARGIYFQDSTFTINKNYITELCEEMIKNKLNLAWACNTRVDCVDEKILKLMKRAGCWMIAYGVESGNQKSLDILNKRTTIGQIEKAIKLTHQQGIVSLGSYILCIPGETFADALNTIKFAKKMAHHMAVFFLPIPYPKTELERLCREDGGLRHDIKWIDYSSGDYSNPVYVNPKIGKEGMQKLLSIAYWRYYTTPRVLINNLLSINCFSDIKRYFRSLKALIGI